MAELVHPERPLGKGFARVTNRAGATLTSANEARAARELRLHFGDGTVDASVEGGRGTGAVERKKPRPYLAPQPGLFDEAEE
jgi:exodeoxyribonuclease VII large subunit